MAFRQQRLGVALAEEKPRSNMDVGRSTRETSEQAGEERDIKVASATQELKDRDRILAGRWPLQWQVMIQFRMFQQHVEPDVARIDE